VSIQIYINGALADAATGITNWSATSAITIGAAQYNAAITDDFPAEISNVQLRRERTPDLRALQPNQLTHNTAGAERASRLCRPPPLAEPEQHTGDPLMPDAATITVNRAPGGTRDRMRAYKILIDDAAAGAVKPGESLTVPVAPGPHTVQMKVDWCTSPTLSIAAAPGTDTALTCAPAGSTLMALFSMLRPGAYIRLEHRP